MSCGAILKEKLFAILGIIITLISDLMKLFKDRKKEALFTIISSLCYIIEIFKWPIKRCCKSRRNIIIDEAIEIVESTEKKAEIFLALESLGDKESKEIINKEIEEEKKIKGVFERYKIRTNVGETELLNKKN